MNASAPSSESELIELTAGRRLWRRVGSFAANHAERWRCQCRSLMVDCYYDSQARRWMLSCSQLNIMGRIHPGSSDWTRDEACLRTLSELQSELEELLKAVATE